MTDTAQRALSELQEFGVLLVADARLPSLTTIVTGGPVRGSWWGHPMGQVIYRAGNELTDHPDVILLKLVARKNTFVHRPLWPAMLAVAQAREPWQLRGLSKPAAALLRQVDEKGEVESAGPAAKELEERLLVLGASVHTDSGAHHKRLEAWSRWAARVGVGPELPAPAAARRQLEAVAQSLTVRFGAPAKLPWQGKGV